MSGLLRTVHVLAVALWFGSVAFFTVAGLLIFDAFEQESMKPAEKRDKWFPLPPEYAAEKPPKDSGLPEPVRKEQGSRAGGVAVSGIFPTYFALQTGCAAVAVLTALAFVLKQGGRLNAVRVIVCVLGMLTVLGGWWLERRVHELRTPRNDLSEAVLTVKSPPKELIEETREAREKFTRWHLISLAVNFATLGLALTAAAMAAHHRQPST